MRVACLQFDPQLGELSNNQLRAERLLTSTEHLDLLLLPEMAFTGYCFESRDEIQPFCEDASTGPTAIWCREQAKRRNCVVVCGFPERAADGRLFNSLLVADRRGEVVHVYRKHFLFTTDETWAEEGPGFSRKEIPGLGRCAFGICMDLNPRKFEAPFDRFEFASALFDPPLAHHERPKPRTQRLGIDWILLCNNWLRAPADHAVPDADHCRFLLNYWATRLTPALGHPATVILANRVGRERGTLFAGCSCVIDLRTRTVLGHLDSREEGVLVVDC